MIEVDGLAILPRRPRELLQEFRVAVFRVGRHGAPDSDILAAR